MSDHSRATPYLLRLADWKQRVDHSRSSYVACEAQLKHPEMLFDQPEQGKTEQNNKKKRPSNEQSTQKHFSIPNIQTKRTVHFHIVLAPQKYKKRLLLPSDSM